MNQRVQQLAEQARASIPQDTLGVDEWIQAYNKKLAELIVLECADIADQERPSYLGCGYITQTKGMMIKQHFGVDG